LRAGEREGIGWRREATLTAGPHLAASARERRGKVGPRWLRGPEGEVGQWRKRKRGRRAVGLGQEERERGLGEFCFFSFPFFSNPISNLFQIQIFYTNFHNYFTNIFKNFHKYFKTFKTTPQPKLMHSNHDAQALIASKLLK
jgi:hypothetical protein